MFIIILSTQHIPPVFTPMWESVDRWKKTGQHSKRQLQQPQYCKAGLMGHVWMQQRGTSSSTCTHICWINEDIFPKSAMYVDRWSEIMGKDVCIHVRYVCVWGVTVCLLVGLKKQQHTDHWSSGVCTHIHFCHAVGRSDSSLSRIVLFNPTPTFYCNISDYRQLVRQKRYSICPSSHWDFDHSRLKSFLINISHIPQGR